MGLEAQIFRRRFREDELLVPAVAEPFLVWIVSGEALLEECDPGSEWHGGVVKAGSFFLTHTDTPYLMRWQAREETPFEVMHLYLDRSLIDRAAVTLGLKAVRCRFRNISIGSDGLISAIMPPLPMSSGSSRARMDCSYKGWPRVSPSTFCVDIRI
ncbi:hypothetical protein [Mesorhizobium amorphae]|uniref:hypothetical protein n=1 Tax=Mesorhizobium amorphae TaxID=71433 RepID=UPI0021B463CA|nr:hypothetical protein [Mesorhizobium amorphae]